MVLRDRTRWGDFTVGACEFSTPRMRRRCSTSAAVGEVEPPDAEEVFQTTGAKFPDHPRWRLLKAGVASRNGDWPEVRQLLRDVDPRSLEPVPRQHFLHLRGIALLRAGEREAGERLIRDAATIDGKCKVDVAVSLLDVLGGHDLPPRSATRPATSGCASGGASARSSTRTRA